MKVLIIEDESLAVKRLVKALEAVPYPIEVIGFTRSIVSSVDWLKRYDHPDLILMDIELADGQSFDIFRQVTVHCPVIFVTSYDEHVIRAFKVNSLDYLMKPVDQEELEAALEKFRELQAMYSTPVAAPVNIEALATALQQKMLPKEYRRRFLVKHGQKLLTINVEEITSFYVDGRLSFFKTFDKRRFVVDYILDELEAMLDPSCFFRINRSSIVSLKAISQVDEYINNRLLLQLSPADEKDCIVSRDRVAAFKDWMGR